MYHLNDDIECYKIINLFLSIIISFKKKKLKLDPKIGITILLFLSLDMTLLFQTNEMMKTQSKNYNYKSIVTTVNKLICMNINDTLISP